MFSGEDLSLKFSTINRTVADVAADAARRIDSHSALETEVAHLKTEIARLKSEHICECGHIAHAERWKWLERQLADDGDQVLLERLEGGRIQVASFEDGEGHDLAAAIDDARSKEQGGPEI